MEGWMETPGAAAGATTRLSTRSCVTASVTPKTRRCVRNSTRGVVRHHGTTSEVVITSPYQTLAPPDPACLPTPRRPLRSVIYERRRIRAHELEHPLDRKS